jgi:hypothetical protein
MMTALRILALYALCVTVALAADEKTDRQCDLMGDADSGLVFVSAMLPDSRPIGAPKTFFYNYRRVDEKQPSLTEKVFVVARTRLLLPVQSDFGGVFGKLVVLKLKAGDYRLTNWSYNDGVNTRWSSRDRVEQIPFRVTAGRATYLGSLEPELSMGGKIFGKDTASAWPTSSDQSKRDVSLFLHKCSQIDIMDVDIAPLDLRPWLP